MLEYYRNIFYLSSGVACIFDRDTRVICDVNANFEKEVGFKHGSRVDDLFLQTSDQVQFHHTVKSFSDFHEFFESDLMSVNGDILRTKWKITDLKDSNKIMMSGELIPDVNSAIDAEDVETPFVFTKRELITILNTAPIGIHFAVDGIILWANQTLLNTLGVEPEEYIGQSPKKYLVDAKAMYEVALRVRGGETVHNYAHRLIAKDGSTKYFTCELDSFHRGDGTIVNRGFLRHDEEGAYSQNVANDQAVKFAGLAAEKEAFIRIMFHEIKTPLHNLSMAFNSFVNDAGQTRDATDDFKHQIDTCTSMVEDLSFATMFESDQVLHPRPVSIALRKELDLILEGLNHEMELSNKSISIDRRVDVNLPVLVSLDRSVLRVMSNLISNAVKYCVSGGVVNVHLGHKIDAAAEDASPQFTFSVTNTVNKPMDLVQVNRMFQSCFNRAQHRADGTREASAKACGGSKGLAIAQSLVSSDGLGLGVYVAYNIIQSLGGMLECSGDATIASFSFALDLPVAQLERPSLTGPTSTGHNDSFTSWSSAADSCAGNKHVLSDSASSSGTVADGAAPAAVSAVVVGGCDAMSKCSEPKRGSLEGTTSLSGSRLSRKVHSVLVVDDSPICRKVLVKLLESNGYATNVACDGQEAVTLLSERVLPYSLVLMDLRMPIMDGITATKRCKEMPHLAELPFIIVTAETGEDVKHAALAAQAAYFINKPVKLNELLEVMERFIKN